MRPDLEGFNARHQLPGGEAWATLDMELFGSFGIPRRIYVEFDATTADPAIGVLIELVNGAPRCTSVALTSGPDGTQVTSQHLRDLREGTKRTGTLARREFLGFEGLISYVLWSLSAPLLALEDGVPTFDALPSDSQRIEYLQDLLALRGLKRQPVSRAVIVAAAGVYNSVDAGGLDAIGRELGVSRATAARYLEVARNARLINEGSKPDYPTQRFVFKGKPTTIPELRERFGWDNEQAGTDDAS